jgi:hypothetical protein
MLFPLPKAEEGLYEKQDVKGDNNYKNGHGYNYFGNEEEETLQISTNGTEEKSGKSGTTNSSGKVKRKVGKSTVTGS